MRKGRSPWRDPNTQHPPVQLPVYCQDDAEEDDDQLEVFGLANESSLSLPVPVALTQEPSPVNINDFVASGGFFEQRVVVNGDDHHQHIDPVFDEKCVKNHHYAVGPQSTKIMRRLKPLVTKPSGDSVIGGGLEEHDGTELRRARGDVPDFYSLQAALAAKKRRSRSAGKSTKNPSSSSATALHLIKGEKSGQLDGGMPLLTEGNELNFEDVCEEKDVVPVENEAVVVGEAPTNTNELATENKNLK